jgi:hypothetical protein
VDRLTNAENAALLAAAFGALASLVPSFLAWRRVRTDHQRLDQFKESNQERINRLSGALNEAIEVIAEIDDQIRLGQERAAGLQRDIQTYENAANLSKQEAEAISRLLESTVNKNQRRALLENFSMNFFFFVLGAAVSLVLSTR